MYTILLIFLDTLVGHYLHSQIAPKKIQNHDKKLGQIKPESAGTLRRQSNLCWIDRLERVFRICMYLFPDRSSCHHMTISRIKHGQRLIRQRWNSCHLQLLQLNCLFQTITWTILNDSVIPQPSMLCTWLLSLDCSGETWTLAAQFSWRENVVFKVQFKKTELIILKPWSAWLRGGSHWQWCVHMYDCEWITYVDSSTSTVNTGYGTQAPTCSANSTVMSDTLRMTLLHLLVTDTQIITMADEELWQKNLQSQNVL